MSKDNLGIVSLEIEVERTDNHAFHTRHTGESLHLVAAIHRKLRMFATLDLQVRHRRVVRNLLHEDVKVTYLSIQSFTQNRVERLVCAETQDFLRDSKRHQLLHPIQWIRLSSSFKTHIGHEQERMSELLQQGQFLEYGHRQTHIHDRLSLQDVDAHPLDQVRQHFTLFLDFFLIDVNETVLLIIDQVPVSEIVVPFFVVKFLASERAHHTWVVTGLVSHIDFMVEHFFILDLHLCGPVESVLKSLVILIQVRHLTGQRNVQLTRRPQP